MISGDKTFRPITVDTYLHFLSVDRVDLQVFWNRKARVVNKVDLFLRRN